jgi:colanic acid biosynthesis protein WcaH
MKLPLHQFKRVVRDSVLVSLDLLIVNERNEVLVGSRKNSPAKGWLFVPGGRVHKGEALRDALQRISTDETGVNLGKEDGTLHGIYDHLYPENAFGEPDISTHYVVIACLFHLRSFIPDPRDDQHEELRMMSIPELLAHPRVHVYARNYFAADPPNLFLGADDSLAHCASFFQETKEDGPITAEIIATNVKASTGTL